MNDSKWGRIGKRKTLLSLEMKPSICSPGMRNEKTNQPLAHVNHLVSCWSMNYYPHFIDEDLRAHGWCGSRNHEMAEQGCKPRSVQHQSPCTLYYDTASQENYCPQRTLEQKQSLGLLWVIFNWYQIVNLFLKSVTWFRRQNLKSKTASSVIFLLEAFVKFFGSSGRVRLGAQP